MSALKELKRLTEVRGGKSFDEKVDVEDLEDDLLDVVNKHLSKAGLKKLAPREASELIFKLIDALEKEFEDD